MRMAMLQFAILCLLSGIVFAACQSSVRDNHEPSASSESSSTSSSGEPDWSIGDAGGGGFGLGGGEPAPREPCPLIEPIPNDYCAHWGMRCEYGDDPRPQCRKRFACLAAGPDPTVWVQFLPEKPCDAINSDACPDAPPGPNLCFPNGTLCLYPDGTQCGCQQTWLCSPPPGAQCPTIAPNFGTFCATEGLTCTYGDCAFGTAMVRYCSSGVWYDWSSGCNG